MKLRKDLKLFAIGGKGWVEIRSGRTAPKPHVTTIEKVIPYVSREVRRVASPDSISGWVWVSKDVNRTKRIVLKTTTFTGGRVLGTLSGRTRKAPLNQVRQVNPECVNGVLEALEERNGPA